MNGRVYDYNLGRFLSVDPFIQAPGNSQSMNPYSYIMNNPLAGTDPSGYVVQCDGPGSIGCDRGQQESWEQILNRITGRDKVALSNGEGTTKKKSSDNEVKPEEVGSTKNNDNALIANKDELTQSEFWKAVGLELWNNKGDYTKRTVTGAVNIFVDKFPEAAKDVSGYSSAREVYDALESGDSDALKSAIIGAGISRVVPGGKALTKSKIWTTTKKRTGVENAFKHWKDHGAEFPEFKNAKQYVEATKSFMRSPPKGTLTKIRSNGDVVRYHEKSNTFGVVSKDGVPRTMYKPDPKIHGYKTNLEYFNDQ